MPTCSFRDFNQVCQSMGLESENSKKGTIWIGISRNGALIEISVHDKAGGRDIPDGTLNRYVKDLGFKNYQEFKEYLNTL